MFLRMMLRSSLVDRSRTFAALLAVVVAAAVTTALLNLYVDVESKLHKEFRGFGANVVVSGDSLPSDALAQVEAALPPGGIAAPFVYAVAKDAHGTPVVVAGADFARVQRLNRWWQVSQWPAQPGEALLGTRAHAQLAAGGKPFELDYGGRKLTVTPAGILRTGADEDSRVYLDLESFRAWAGLGPNTIEVAVPGSAAEVERTVERLRAALPGARVEPVRQIVEAEANVLEKTRGALLGATTIVIVLATMCLLATLTASVLNRRKDFAVMKALGASQGTVSAFFLAETTALGVLGSVAGFALGVGLAMWIGQANFHAAVAPRWGVFPVVLGGTLLMAGAAALLPMTMLRRVQPASLLRGE